MHLHCCVSVGCICRVYKDNAAADHWSCDSLSSFLQLVPNASPQPTILPDRLMEALVEHQPDWASLTWRVVFRSILHMDSSHTPKRHTSPEKPLPEVL
jgi:hypothetical protein